VGAQDAPMSATEGIWDESFSGFDICYSSESFGVGYGPADGHGTNFEGNWHAIRMKFDAAGKFLGYYVAYCDHSYADGHVKYKVRFVLKQWCPTIADVASGLVSPTENSAPRTDRLWKESKKPYTLPTLGYDYGTEISPFGSLSISKLSSLNLQLNLSAFTGVPDCKGSGVDSCTISSGIKNNQTLPYQESVVGAPYSCPNGKCVRSITLNKGEINSKAAQVTRQQGSQILSELFARVRSVYEYTQGTYAKTAAPNDFVQDRTETANGIRPPVVLSVGSCDDTGKCLENTTTTGISVNDSDGGLVKVLTPSARMFVRFFAFADANQMPLRHLEVDWGDGRVYPLDGMFRNARGYKQATCVANKCQIEQVDDMSQCSQNSDCASGKCIRQDAKSDIGRCLEVKQFNACVNDQDCNLVPACVEKTTAASFGTVADLTCDNNYFQFEHVYQCARIPVSQGGNFYASANDCGDPRSFPNGCCVFVPKVRVIDNWGWCNGYCPGGVGGNGCYNDTQNSGANECLGSASTTGSWNAFNGRIIVAPPIRPR
jgi:hypothetical protein